MRATTAALDVTPVTGQYTRYVALHPLGQYTSYVALHPNREGALPMYRVHCLRIGCSTLTNEHNGGHNHSRTHTSTSRALILRQGVATPPTAAPRG